MAATKYKVLVGLNYPPNNRRAEVGDVVSDLPDFAVNKLLKAGVIEEVKTKAEKAKEPEKDTEEVIVTHVAANTDDGVKVTEEKVEL